MNQNINFSMQDFVKYITDLDEKVVKARQYWIDNGKLIDQRNKLALENKKIVAATDVLIDKIETIKKERNDIERELNRVQFNMIKTIAIGMTEGDYSNLLEIEQHYWREYAALVSKENGV
jgi:hypothetical protein